MRYENNQRLRGYLERGAAGAYREHMRHPRFEIDGVTFAAALSDVRAQHPSLTDDEAQARAVFRLLTMGAPPEVALPLPSPGFRARAWFHRMAPRAVPWVKVLWAIAVLTLCAIAAHAEPDPPGMRAIRNAMAGWPAQIGQPSGLVIQFQNGGTVLATRPAGLVALNCSTNMTCSFSGYTLTLTASGGGGSGFNAISSGTNTTATMHVGGGATLDFTGAGVLNASRIQGQAWSATGPSNGHIPIWNATNSDWEPGDPIVSGPDATGIAPTKNPVQTGALDNSTACSSGPCVRSFIVASGAPAGGEYGVIVRNIPSGTQTVSGTVAATESGTWPVRAQDGSGNALTSTSSALDVNIKSGSIANTTFAATQSGTWNVTNVSGTVSLPSGAATAPKQPALGTAGTPSSDVITVQGAAGMTKLLVTPDSVALPANQSVNVSQINGVTPLMGSGNGGTGSLRVNIASDQAAVPAGQSGTWTVQPGNTPNTTPWLITQTPSSASGQAISTTTTKTAVTSAVAVKASAGNLYGYAVQNGATAAVCYLQLINAASSPALGTASMFSVYLPESAATVAQPSIVMFPYPINFSTGISVGFSTAYNGSSACGTAGNVTLFYN